MTTQTNPTCPSYEKAKRSNYDSCCSRCIEGKGDYLRKGEAYECSFYFDVFLPRWKEEQHSELERAMGNLGGRRR